ncbi:unnamed protein product [Plutella xylostella]|uniref:(diamondback moth) hypothetical protein n=1 Tax=Plutella xylostella TaxID=51655 RepID=A0A8S4GAV5_PLUXY|nr:unnamed protein product [Plutella xylostella]
MNIIVCYERRKISQDVPQIIPLLLVLFSILRAENTLGCPSDLVSSKCSCYDFEDGVFVDCQEATAKDIKNTLKNVTNINSLSVIDLDEDDEYLGPNFIPPGVCVKHVHISQTNLRDLADDSFEHLRKCLETLSIVSAFRNLNKITLIDLDRNKLHNLSLELLTSIESHIQEITLKDNIMICNCEKDNTWVWIQDHPKIIKPTAVSCLNNEYPTEKCDIPIISQLSIDKHKDNSVSVSWFIRNRTAIKSLQLLYYAEDIDSEVKRENLERDEVSARLNDLEPNANYVVCVITLDEDPLDLEDFTQIIETNNTYLKYNGTEETRRNQEVAASILMHSPSNNFYLTIEKSALIIGHDILINDSCSVNPFDGKRFVRIFSYGCRVRLQLDTFCHRDRKCSVSLQTVLELHEVFSASSHRARP